MQCGRCKLTQYCDKVCQKQHWKKDHKAACNLVVANKAKLHASVARDLGFPVKPIAPVVVKEETCFICSSKRKDGTRTTLVTPWALAGYLVGLLSAQDHRGVRRVWRVLACSAAPQWYRGVGDLVMVHWNGSLEWLIGRCPPCATVGWRCSLTAHH